MKFIKYWLFRKFNDNVPHPEQIGMMASAYPYTNRIKAIGLKYAETKSLEETAIYFNVTRERVRQIVMKIHRMYGRVTIL